MSIVYIALGSNLGDRQKNLNDAMCLLKELGINILRSSNIIETDPLGGPPQNKYLNSVIKIETTLSPNDLLFELKQIELKLGRIRTVKNGPRTIDLDILLFDEITLTTDSLTIPHPRMLERDFVLGPLTEIEPDIANSRILNQSKN